jgi:D-amino peptidase
MTERITTVANGARRIVRCALAVLAVLAALVVQACAAAENSAVLAQADGRELFAPVPNPTGEIRVLLLHDMEGLSGQDDPRTFFYGEELYATGQQLLVADVNAVIDGLFAGGATAVDVVDGHGSGNPEPDILSAQLDPRARQVFRDAPFRQYVDLVEPRAWDAVAVVGMHAKTGSGGFASHTYTLGIDLIVNDMSITETELVGYSFGRVGVPVIFASGDDRLREDLRTMPWLEYVTTKHATAADAAEFRPVAEVHAEMRAAAQRAVENLESARAMRLTTPIRAALRAVPPASLALLEDVPGIDYQDETVRFTAADFAEAYDGLIALVTVARSGYTTLLHDAVRAHPAGADIMRDNRARLLARWYDVESGRWSPPARPSPAGTGRRYHGAH